MPVSVAIPDTVALTGCVAVTVYDCVCATFTVTVCE